MPVPKFDDLFNPLLQAFHNLGGSASIDELEEETGKVLKLTEKELQEPHHERLSKLAYRLAWARNYLKNFEILENSSRGVWALTEKGRKTKSVDKAEVKKIVRNRFRDSASVEEGTDEGKGLSSIEKLWSEELLNELFKISPAAFERLCQRVLRESGFVQVEVTGRSGDGGIDGKGTLRVGLLGFRVLFQCKRYKGSVPPKEIREFQGVMTGRAEKGIFITTGTFTRDAKSESIRVGAPTIDLIDGEQLVQKMKELNLGVKVRMEEEVKIDRDWLKSI